MENKNFKILIVDDEKNIRRTVRLVLEGEGFGVEEASSGEEALARYAEESPDLVMPKLNGFEVLQQIRLNFADKWRPVIIVSANDELEVLKKCYGMEADHYLTKPCSPDNLLRGIQTMISLIPLRIK